MSINKNKSEKIILGIDPGTNKMGYGIIRVIGSTITLIETDIIDLSKLEDHPIKLKNIFEKTLALIEKYLPDEVAIEAPFLGKNVQSMLKLGRAQGVAIAAAVYRDVTIFEYTPKKIKQSITGSGNASKEQVAAMLKNLKLITEIPKDLDSTDGLAAAVCHHFQGGRASLDTKSYSGWVAFAKQNPEKIKTKS